MFFSFVYVSLVPFILSFYYLFEVQRAVKEKRRFIFYLENEVSCYEALR